MSFLARSASTAAPPLRDLGIDLVRSAIAKSMAESDLDSFVEARWSDTATSAVIKAAVAAGTATTFAPDGTSTAGASFFQGVLGVGALGAVLQRAVQAPFGMRLLATTTPTQASWVAEGSARPLTTAVLTPGALQPYAFNAVSVITDEALKTRDLLVEAVLLGELTRATRALLEVTAFDATAATGARPAGLLAGVSPYAAASVIDALLALVDEFQGDPDSAVFVMPPLSKARLELVHNHPLPTVADIPIATSSGIGGNTIALIDGNGIAVDVQGASPTRLRETSLQMSDSPDSPSTGSTVEINLWQHNLIALAVAGWASWAVVRPGAVLAATLGDSPTP